MISDNNIYYIVVNEGIELVTGYLEVGQELSTNYEVQSFEVYSDYLSACDIFGVEAVEEVIRVIPHSITQGQGKLTLLAMGLLPTVEYIVSQAGEEEKIYWEYWATWTRDSVILNRIAPMIGWGDSELDEFFVKASSFV